MTGAEKARLLDPFHGGPRAAFDYWIPLVNAVGGWAELEESTVPDMPATLRVGYGHHQAIDMKLRTGGLVALVMKAFVEGAWCASLHWQAQLASQIVKAEEEPTQ